MSTKTEICGFSGHIFHAGHGRVHIREDKHLMAFESRKAFRMWERKRNPRKIAWTEHYRHDHKKSVADTAATEKRAQRKKATRTYAGVAMEGNQHQMVQIVKKRVARKPVAKKN
ncbi:ribosomal protein L24e, putative [Trichomonas vaginalis G3]|uniref:Ribosomal protein L24e, putative n=1 Tax=Trichomonas vaginalis (strain ATCC PRA-98 / G3) TaxID=412133 RepID=A2DJQ1_TRIV3|nr:assembly of large subunit precursor of preribosome [Trichomonas vaginalis G3]XP_001314118.1 assembly of large subunit precursor of preribosome [Trichomonas vaginalis G3]XP_001580121.1 assembly of large subunit precursor of preribosome [Trichomonas vaginalis G3]XP_001580437.1 assembly of large subunit precursor of preribosome [Trichomonas vaginalis G3]5XY3_W Chain W, Ribosomal protein L24e, putative [Trichomonas vaginalis]EAX85539.1 ribosomal protein L24e, putative [Trichomonas vaginalis G3]|eukprot:XP_001298469.1 ribosomal protein L24e [Trichomonas vaginalis G3]